MFNCRILGAHFIVSEYTHKTKAEIMRQARVEKAHSAATIKMLKSYGFSAAEFGIKISVEELVNVNDQLGQKDNNGFDFGTFQ